MKVLSDRCVAWSGNCNERVRCRRL